MSATIRRIISAVLFACVFSTLYSQQYMDYLQLGKNELQADHYTKAIADLNIYIKVQPQMYEGYFFRGYAKYQLDDLMGAEQDYTVAISLYPFSVDLFCYRVRLPGTGFSIFQERWMITKSRLNWIRLM